MRTESRRGRGWKQRASSAAMAITVLFQTTSALGQTPAPPTRDEAPAQPAGARPDTPLAAQGAAAQPDTTSASRQALDGLAAYEAGDYERAVELLTSALGELPLPTIAYYAARAHLELGHLTEAAALYQRAIDLPPTGPEDKRPRQLEAQTKARTELQALQRRIPLLTLRVRSSSPSRVTVTVDGTAVSQAALQQPLPLNPGQHEIVARCGEAPPVSSEITLAEGARQVTELEVTCSGDTATALGPSATGLGDTATEPGPSDAGAGKRRGPAVIPIAGWTAIGVGGAAWGTWMVAGLLGQKKLSDLQDDDTCDSDHNCVHGSGDDLKPYRSLRTVSTAGFWSGGILLATGAGLLVWNRSRGKEHAAKVEIEPWVSPGAAGVRGAF